MAKKYICNACDTFYDSTHKRDRVCSICTAKPPCTKDGSMYCATCNKWFLSEKCFQNHLIHKVKVKLVFRWRQVCPNCSFTVTCDNKHESFKRFSIIVIRSNFLAILATWLPWILASWQTGLCMFLSYGVHTGLWKARWVLWICS